MGMAYYSLEQLPDFTMAKYSTQEFGDVDAVLKQHSVLYRQLHRRGILFGESYALQYWYDPGRPAGQKLRLLFRVTDRKNTGGGMMDAFLQSTPLHSCFPLAPYGGGKLAEQHYACQAVLTKRCGKIPSSLMSSTEQFFTVDDWKTNENGRLMSLFRMMKSLNQPCVYEIQILPLDISDTYRDALQTRMKWMKQSASGLGGIAAKDENAEKCIRHYGDIIDKLRKNPHFYCQVSVYADDPAAARLLLDSAAAEAVEEGSYSILDYSRKDGFYPMRETVWSIPKADAGSDQLAYWHILFLLEELTPLAAFPTLYPAEAIEIPKETAPRFYPDGLNLGTDTRGYTVSLPLDMLPKHAFLAGVPGSGKTFTMLHLASQLAGKQHNIPILVLEPAKTEYRALLQNPNVRDITVFAPGGRGCFPLRVNPFEFPVGMKLAEYIVSLRDVFIGAFDLEAPMPMLLDEAIENVYRAQGWYPFEYNAVDTDGSPIHPYPDMQQLYDEIQRLMDSGAYQYADDVKNNLKTVLQVRIGSLLRREIGNVFNVKYSTFHPEEWMQHSCILELESLGKDAANFLTLLLVRSIREYIRMHPKSQVSPRHVIFIEEAHNLIGPSTIPNGQSGNAKIASTQFLVDMLAEVRALKEAIIIADQLPTALAPQVTKNTALKIALRMTAQDDRELLASTMSADSVQLEQMALFTKGRSLCLYDGVQKPFEVQITQYPGNPDSPDDETLYSLQKDRPTYRMCMERDYLAMSERLKAQLQEPRDILSGLETERNQDTEALKKVYTLTDPEEIKQQVSALKNRKAMRIGRRKKQLEAMAEKLMEFEQYLTVNRLMADKGKKLLNAYQPFLEYYLQNQLEEVSFAVQKRLNADNLLGAAAELLDTDETLNAADRLALRSYVDSSIVFLQLYDRLNR